jgi:dTDP-4-dehydrorhamnose reductase
MWLLIGGDSELGAATLRHALGLEQAVVATTRRRDRVGSVRPFLDLAQPLDDWVPPAGIEAACVFAAVARLVDCQADPEGSSFVNVAQTRVLAERLISHGAYLLFLSTNQVFDGSTSTIAAGTARSPISEYGWQKARAEALLAEYAECGGQIGILRLTKVISPTMPLLHRWLDALSARRPIRAFADMPIAPVPISTVTATIAALLRDSSCGTFQLSGPADVTYTDVALHLAGHIGAPAGLVEAVSAASAEMPIGSTPRHTTLSCTALRDRYGIVVPGVWSVIDGVIDNWRSSRRTL